MTRLRVGVIGVGHLGKEHARILAGFPDVELVGVADVRSDLAEAVARRWNTRAYADHRPLLSCLDAAVIVVPTLHHHAVAAEFLRRGISLLVEKPLAISLDEAEDLIALATRHRAILQVGHIERFNPAFEEFQQHSLRPLFIRCERLSPFSGRSTDIGAILDLMIHDLDLVLAIVASPARAVHAIGMSVLGAHEDVVHAHVVFANGCVANLTANRINATSLRRLEAWGPEGLATIDFSRRSLTLVQPSEHLRRFPLDLARIDGARLKEELFGKYLRLQEFDRNEGDQLTRELQDFVQCVRQGRRPRVSGEDGRNAIALATRVHESMRMNQEQCAFEGLPAMRSAA